MLRLCFFDEGLCHFFNHIINNTLSKITNRIDLNWNEDYITRSILNDLTNEFSEIEWSKDLFYTKWNAFKLNGSKEKNYGDIAILVKLENGKGNYTEGVAFYEAKRVFPDIDKNKGLLYRYRSIKNEQLERLENVITMSVLLYDMDPKIVTAIPIKTFNMLANSNRMVISPKEHTLGLNFGDALFLNLKGIKLDYSHDSVQAIKNIISEPYPGLNTIVAVSGSKDISLKQAYSDSDDIGKVINKLYSPISNEKFHD
ncbi:TPA: hypothetical protein ACQFXC_001628 [Proteus mirabilis]|uniref:hypothetical protein n=1 Tax=Proteus mirabilis TaxID=584 RepID=UPI000BD98D77|nr:hypothetical protein [Proteus mirabilis]ELA9901867.1 hypothetical protein [Proteus mirabilis]PCQ33842.1 hypothetical protein CQA21_10035 [Proteus mirabilis]HBC6622479.1 hypothetical protein [Proteus mirabilis]